MAAKDRFTSTEWESLERAPVLVARKATAEDAIGFKRWLLEIARSVAGAS